MKIQVKCLLFLYLVMFSEKHVKKHVMAGLFGSPLPAANVSWRSDAVHGANNGEGQNNCEQME
jgi:hypothetical protein